MEEQQSLSWDEIVTAEKADTEPTAKRRTWGESDFRAKDKRVERARKRRRMAKSQKKRMGAS